MWIQFLGSEKSRSLIFGTRGGPVAPSDWTPRAMYFQPLGWIHLSRWFWNPSQRLLQIHSAHQRPEKIPKMFSQHPTNKATFQHVPVLRRAGFFTQIWRRRPENFRIVKKTEFCTGVPKLQLAWSVTLEPFLDFPMKMVPQCYTILSDFVICIISILATLEMVWFWISIPSKPCWGLRYFHLICVTFSGVSITRCTDLI